MEQSLYIEEVRNRFPGLAQRVVKKINDTANPLTYLHRRMLTKRFSTNLKWESLTTVNGGIVAADVVAMDSSLPLKTRDSLVSATGDIPKLGIELVLREKQLTELGILSRTPGRREELVAALFADTPRVISAQYELLEYMFLLGLSTGVSVHSDTLNVGTGVRLDYGYIAANITGVPVVWSNPASTPFADLQNRPMTKAAADGNRIIRFMLDQATWRNIAKTTEAKELFAASVGYFGDTTKIPVANFAQLNTAAQAQYGFTFEIVERTVRFEKNGIRQSVKPWSVGAVVGITSENVGTLTYGTLAEMEHPVPNAIYTTVDDFMLVSKFRLNRPSLSEHTTSQSLIAPVIDGVDGIYIVKSETVEA